MDSDMKVRAKSKVKIMFENSNTKHKEYAIDPKLVIKEEDIMESAQYKIVK